MAEGGLRVELSVYNMCFACSLACMPPGYSLEGPALFMYMDSGLSDLRSLSVYDSRPPWLVSGLV